MFQIVDNGYNEIMKKLLMICLSLVAFAFGFASSSSAAVITVQKGDSMWKIANEYKVSFAEILRLNKHYINPHMIHPNDKIYIPDGSHGLHTAEHSESDSIGKGNATAATTEIPAQAEAILNLVNAERAKQGLNALKLSDKLTSIANTKAQDMGVNNYFSHTSPTYGSPFEMLQHFGVTYKSAGENIAAGQRSPDEVMQAWMNSSGHRANILNKNFTMLGVGYYKGGSYGTEWVQMFIGN
mgnify:CR=1 FL=1